MTREEQDAYWYKYNRFHNSKAAQHKPAVYKALQAQIKHFADTKNIDTIPMQPVYDVIKAIYVDVGPLWSHQAYLSVMRQAGARKNAVSDLHTKKRMPIGFNEDFINAIINYFNINLLNDAVLPITETTKDFIREQLIKGANEGFSIDEIVQQLLTTGITRRRAEMISRTEVGKAANAGAKIGVDKTGLQTNKIWLSVLDNRVRRDHRNVNNQMVPEDQPFIVGEEKYQMDHPMVSKSNDGRAIPGREIIQCRCTYAHRVLRGNDGLPLRK